MDLDFFEMIRREISSCRETLDRIESAVETAARDGELDINISTDSPPLGARLLRMLVMLREEAFTG